MRIKELVNYFTIKRKFFSGKVTLLLISGAFYLVFLTMGWAASQSTSKPADMPAKVTFNHHFLMGQAQGIDLSRFRDGNPVLAGKYSLDIYVNNEWKGKKSVEFTDSSGKSRAETCFNLLSLEELGVDTAVMGSGPAVTNATCKLLDQWIPTASYYLDISILRMDISIPQVALRRAARGYVDPKFWDRGITAGFLSYNVNTFNSRSPHSAGHSEATNTYLMLSSGVNIASWQLHHDANVNWRSQEKPGWHNTATYAQRAIPGVGAMLTLGDTFTRGDFSESIGFRGMQIATDDRMLPDSLNGYAPVVHGVAQSNALVEIRQNNQLIFQTTVAPGEFEIDDLYPTWHGGDLDVVVTEVDGRVRQFRVPYTSAAQMLRTGSQRYAFTVGQVREENLSKKPGLLQVTYQRGFNNILTGYAGVTVSDGYSAALLGNVVATPLGAFSVDVTQANTRLKRYGVTGQSYKLSYSKMIPETHTNFTVAGYRYSLPGYLSLRDALYARDAESRGRATGTVNRQRSEYQLTLNQDLGDDLGSLYLTGSIRNYRSRDSTTKQYQMGYNNFINRVTYSLSAMRVSNTTGRDDTGYYLNVSIPLNVNTKNFSLNSMLASTDRGYESNQIGFSGSTGVDNNISYSATLTNERGGGNNSSVSGEYRNRFATMHSSYSYGHDFRQFTLGASGSIVAHSGGITMTPQRGQTMVLVEALDAVGASVTNTPGVYIDNNGYAVVPYITPYRMTNITLDPNGMSRDVELESSSKPVTPYAGAIAKLTFKTIKGNALIIHAIGPNGKALPFGAEVLDNRNQGVGIVGQGSRIYLRTEALHGLLLVKWGTQPTQQCTVNYSAHAQSSTTYDIIEASCQ